MAHVVLGIGTSHGPSIQTPPEQWARLADGDTRDPRFNFQDLLRTAKPSLEQEVAIEVQRKRHAAAHTALRKLSSVVDDARLDVVIIISNIHRVHPADSHPVFGVFRAGNFAATNRSDQPFDPDERFVPEARRRSLGPTVDVPGRADLANYLIDSLIEEGFDIACRDQHAEGATLDDAFTFPNEWLFDGASPPMLPFELSRDLPNQATANRCYELGTALRRRIDAWPVDLRLGIIASGGLSHQIIDEELDRKVIRALVGGDANVLRSLSRAQLNRAPGTPEILNWIVAAAALAPTTMTLIDYLPCYRSLAGTGHGLAFGYWR